MQEDFLHYLWKFKKLSGMPLYTTQGYKVVIKSLGIHNHHSGPDFFNARLTIAHQDWAGNVEMHIKASDWYAHGHDDDPAYNNVILHVVWNNNAQITRCDGVQIPVIEVSKYVDDQLINRYNQLFDSQKNKFINCQYHFNQVDPFTISLWFEKLFIERLESRCTLINQSLIQTHNDWESVFFKMLCKSFGTKINNDAFEQLSHSIGITTLRKLSQNRLQLEATLLGQAGLLDGKHHDPYVINLGSEYAFAKAKYQLKPILTPMKFFRLRPANYPTIRLAQLAMLYHTNTQLLGEVILANTRDQLQQLFNIQASSYWDTHHLFDKPTKPRKKKLTTSFIDLIIINCILPIKFAHAQHNGKDNTEQLLDIMRSIKAESNTIVKSFNRLKPITNALESQAVLQLKPHYCDRNKCLQCNIGVALLKDT